MKDYFKCYRGTTSRIGSVGCDVYQDIDHNMIDIVGKFESEEKAKAAAISIKSHDKLIEVLKSLVYCSENNTGAHPSVDCYHRAIDESKELLKELGHEI